MERMTYRLEDQYGNPTDKIILESDYICMSTPKKLEVVLSRLAAYEETGLEPEEIELLAKQRDLYVDACGELPLKRIRELAQADREGRIVLRSAGAGKQCGSCGHWHRIRDTRRGTCDVRQWLRDRYGASDPGASFTPAQSYGACRDYIPVEGRGNG